MNKVFSIGIGVFSFLILGGVFDSLTGTYNPSTGTMLFHTNYAQIAMYIALGYIAIVFYLFLRWSYHYPQILHLKSFANGIEEIKPLGHILELPGRTSKQIKLQNSPFSTPFYVNLGEGDSKFDYWDCEIKFKDWLAYHGIVMPMIVGNITETKVPEEKPANASKHWKPRINIIQTFTPILLSKNYEKFLYGITQDVLQKLNKKLIKESRRDVDRLEQDAKIIDTQRTELEELHQRLLRLSRESVSKPYNTVMALFCRMLDVDQREVNQEQFMKLLNSLKPQDIALQMQNQIVDSISRQVAPTVSKMLNDSIQSAKPTVFINAPPTPTFQLVSASSNQSPLLESPTKVGKEGDKK